MSWLEPTGSKKNRVGLIGIVVFTQKVHKEAFGENLTKVYNGKPPLNNRKRKAVFQRERHLTTAKYSAILQRVNRRGQRSQLQQRLQLTPFLFANLQINFEKW